MTASRESMASLRAEREALRARVAELEAGRHEAKALLAHLQLAADLIDCLTDGMSPAETAADYREWLRVKHALGLK